MTLASPDKTGAARMAQVFCRALHEAGHQVRLIHGPVPAASILDEMRAVGVDLQTEERLAFPLSRSVPRRVAALAREWGSQAVIGVNQRDRAVALEAASCLRVPGLIMMQSLHKFWGRWPIAALKKLYYTSVLKRSLRLAVCCSEAVQGELIRDFGIDPARTSVLPNGIEVDRYGPLELDRALSLRASLGICSEELMLLNVGRIDLQKGQDVLVEALALLSVEVPWKLVLVGGLTSGAGQARSQEFRNQLESQIARLGLGRQVIFAGWRDDIAELLGAADVYVHSARYEGWPLAVLEAMATELPVVATDCVGRPEGFVDGRHGFIVRTEDAHALAGALQQTMVLSAAQRRAWGREGRELVTSRYDVSVLGRKFVQLVESSL